MFVWPNDLGRHVCRTKLPPKHFQIDTKNGSKNAKRDPQKTIRNAFEKLLAPLRPLKNISPALFNKFFKSFSPPKICTEKKSFFSPRGSAGVATPKMIHAQYDWTTGVLDNGNEWRKFRQEKRAQRLSFWVWRPPGGVGVFHAKGWWPKTSCPPSKLCLPWVSKRGIRDVPGILPGCPGPLAVFKKLVQKNFVRIFRSLEVPRRTSPAPLAFPCFVHCLIRVEAEGF